MTPVRVCFVCLGNICRSPTAEGVFRALVAEAGMGAAVEVDSAGTGGWHVGEPPDRRAFDEARRRGVVLAGRARRFAPADFDRFDLVVAMDASNVADLRHLAPDPAASSKIRLLRSFDPATPNGADVPDPYYNDAFAEVYDVIEAGCRGLLDRIRAGEVP